MDLWGLGGSNLILKTHYLILAYTEAQLEELCDQRLGLGLSADMYPNVQVQRWLVFDHIQTWDWQEQSPADIQRERGIKGGAIGAKGIIIHNFPA